MDGLSKYKPHFLVSKIIIPPPKEVVLYFSNYYLKQKPLIFTKGFCFYILKLNISVTVSSILVHATNYIMPGIPPPIGGIAGSSSLMSTKAHSVVKIIPATEAAFSKAIRVTFLGSIIPALSISTYCSDFAS